MVGLEIVSLSGAGLENEEAPALAEQLRKFPALKQLDVSRNPKLGCVGAAAVLSALSGMLHTGALSLCALMFKVTPMRRDAAVFAPCKMQFGVFVPAEIAFLFFYRGA